MKIRENEQNILFFILFNKFYLNILNEKKCLLDYFQKSNYWNSQKKPPNLCFQSGGRLCFPHAGKITIWHYYRTVYLTMRQSSSKMWIVASGLCSFCFSGFWNTAI